MTADQGPSHNHARSRRRALLPLSFAAGALLIAFQALQWKVADWLGTFLVPVVALPVFGIFLAVCLHTLREAAAGIRHRDRHRVLPLGVCLAAIGIATRVPWTDITLEADFRVHRDARERVAKLVEQKKLLPPGGSGLVTLPRRDRHLSAGGGEIVVDGTDVLFYTYRGVLDNFAGFVYSASGAPPHPLKFGGVLRKIVRKDAQWFWVAAS